MNLVSVPPARALLPRPLSLSPTMCKTIPISVIIVYVTSGRVFSAPCRPQDTMYARSTIPELHAAAADPVSAAVGLLSLELSPVFHCRCYVPFAGFAVRPAKVGVGNAQTRTTTTTADTSSDSRSSRRTRRRNSQCRIQTRYRE